MTNEEAIKILERYEPMEWGDDQVAFEMAYDALNKASAYEQTKWERDVALRTLEEHGIGLGKRAQTHDWNNHKVACLLADMFGDTCACNYCGIDEWLPEVCDFARSDDPHPSCPHPVGVACWEQFLEKGAKMGKLWERGMHSFDGLEKVLENRETPKNQTHEKRTETHGVCKEQDGADSLVREDSEQPKESGSELDRNLISRWDAINRVEHWIDGKATDDAQARAVAIINDLRYLPSADRPKEMAELKKVRKGEWAETIAYTCPECGTELMKPNRPKGKWVDEHENGHGFWVGRCNQCGKESHVSYFCPNCGAKMDKGGDAE